jgi:AcrR family transcriptional regulator
MTMVAERPPLRARKKAETREKIVKVAAELFEDKGFESTTLEEIADRADIHKQTVLRYFRTKQDIALAPHADILRQFEAELSDPARTESVLDCWRRHIERNAKAVGQADGDPMRVYKLVHSNDTLLAHSQLLQRRYATLLSRALSVEAGADPDLDSYAIMLSAMLVQGGADVAWATLQRGSRKNLAKACLAVVDFAIACFPSRDRFAPFAR